MAAQPWLRSRIRFGPLGTLTPWPARSLTALPAARRGVDEAGANPEESASVMAEKLRFIAVVELGGKTATGLQVPDDVVRALGPGKRPAVRVTVGGHTYRTTVAPMGGQFWVPLSAENRQAAGVAAGEQVDVTVEADTAPREVPVPDDLAQALADDGAARDFFDTLAYSHRKEWVRWITEAKKPQTRDQRLQATVEALRAGQRTR